MKYRSKVIEIEAVEYTGSNTDEVRCFLDGGLRTYQFSSDRYVIIHTLEGDMKALPGDFIIRGLEGEYYPCKSSIFHAKYEPIKGQGVTR